MCGEVVGVKAIDRQQRALRGCSSGFALRDTSSSAVVFSHIIIITHNNPFLLFVLMNETMSTTTTTTDGNTSKAASVVKLKSIDGDVLEMDLESAKHAEFLANALNLEDDDDDDDDDAAQNGAATTTQLDVYLSTNVLQKLIEFLQHCKEEPMKSIDIPFEGNSIDEVRPKQNKTKKRRRRRTTLV